MESNHANERIYEFEGFRLDSNEQELRRGSERITLTPKAVELLTILVERHGQIVTREEILNDLWRDTFVDESNLTVTVSVLRRAFCINANDRQFIETVPKRGYRFNAEVRTPKELVVDRQTLTHIKIKETETSDNAGNSALENLNHRVGRRSLVLAAVVICVGVFAAGSSVYFLRQATPPASAVSTNADPVRSIAVLPFKNLNQNGVDEFMNIGLTDALITKLGAVRGLIIRPTSAVLPFAETPETAQSVGEKLSIENILEGTIQRVGERLRVSVQLVRAADGAIVWSSRFDENSQDIFKIQDSLSAQVAEALSLKLSGDERGLLAKADTENAEAYRLYLKGRFFWNKRDLKQAVVSFEQAVTLDNRYAQAFAGIGASYLLLGGSAYGAIPRAEAKAKARAAMEKALELDPNIAEAYAVLGNLELNYDWDIYTAERSYRRAIEINPNYPTAHHWLGWCLVVQRRFDEAEAAFKRAAKLDPTSMAIATEQGYPAFFAGDLARAETIFRNAVGKDGTYASARMCLWRALHHAGRTNETMPQIEATESIVGTDIPVVLMARGRTLAMMGNMAEANAIYQKLITRKQNGEYLSPLFLALLAADLDHRDETFRWLDETFKERNDYLLLLPIAPEFKRFADDPRFQELIDRVGA